MVFFLVNGAGCIAERTFRRWAGRKVRGIGGWLWTWGLVLLVGQNWLATEYSTGWVGAQRSVFGAHPEFSAVVWGVHALGWGPSPAEIHAQRSGVAPALGILDP